MQISYKLFFFFFALRDWKVPRRKSQLTQQNLALKKKRKRSWFAPIVLQWQLHSGEEMIKAMFFAMVIFFFLSFPFFFFKKLNHSTIFLFHSLWIISQTSSRKSSNFNENWYHQKEAKIRIKWFLQKKEVKPISKLCSIQYSSTLNFSIPPSSYSNQSQLPSTYSTKYLFCSRKYSITRQNSNTQNDISLVFLFIFFFVYYGFLLKILFQEFPNKYHLYIIKLTIFIS